jgi:glycine dehydrogenase subunit 1
VKAPKGFEAVREALLTKKIVAGLPLVKYYPELAEHYLFCATETASKSDMDLLIKEVSACTI